MLPAALALAAGLTTAAPAAAGPAAAPGARTVSSGWNDFSCRPSAAHPRPVVLAHGTFGNSVDNWIGLAPYLVARGYCVFSLDYGQIPGIPLFHGLAPVADSARQLAAYVDRVLKATGARETDIVGHSQGGMMPRQYLKFHGGADRVNALIGLGPSNHGTDAGGLSRLLDRFPGVKEHLDGYTPGLTDQLVGSDLLTRLNEGGDTVPGVRYTVIATRYDDVVTPYRSQFLHGPAVRNVLVQDLCAANRSGHAALGLTDRVAFHEVANALDPAHATPTTCAHAKT